MRITVFLGSIVVSIPAYHAGHRGSIPHRGRFFALRSLCSALVDFAGKGEIFVVSAYDITDAFGSLIYSQAILELIRRGVAVDFVGPLFYMSPPKGTPENLGVNRPGWYPSVYRY